MKRISRLVCGAGVIVMLCLTQGSINLAFGKASVTASVSQPIAATKPTEIPTSQIAVTTILTATANTDWRSKLPRDEKGRIIGGEFFPVINYSPTMITGKPCPRITKWTFSTVATKAGKIGISDDPCVVQNAVDDVVRTLYFFPAFNNPKSFKDIAKLFAVDPAIVKGMDSVRRTSLLNNYYNGKTTYNRCDKPNYHLLNVDAKTPLMPNNDGTVTGSRMQVTFLRVAKNIQPFLCEFVTYGDGKTVGKLEVTASMIEGKTPIEAIAYDLFWNSQTQHWVLLKVNGVPFPQYRETAKALLEASPVKPE